MFHLEVQPFIILFVVLMKNRLFFLFPKEGKFYENFH